MEELWQKYWIVRDVITDQFWSFDIFLIINKSHEKSEISDEFID